VIAAQDLAGIPLFASLSDAEREALASDFSEKTAEAGSHLIGEGAPGYSFFVLTEGTAVVTARGETLAELGPGDYFGEIAILEGGRRTASVTTTSRVKLLVMSADAFRRLQDTHPQIAAEVGVTVRRRHAG
jgi:CRP-like cAMP-binding protein